MDAKIVEALVKQLDEIIEHFHNMKSQSRHDDISDLPLDLVV